MMRKKIIYITFTFNIYSLNPKQQKHNHRKHITENNTMGDARGRRGSVATRLRGLFPLTCE